MERTRNQAVTYTIERKFSGRISVAEFVGRIIRFHLNGGNGKGIGAK